MRRLSIQDKLQTNNYLTTETKDADYPGLLPYEQSRAFFDHELNRDARYVRGSMVSGFSDQEMHFLDLFEGEVSHIIYT
jgi:hypothetical protein